MINQYTIHLDFNSYPRFTHSIGYSNCKLRKRITNLREKIAQLDIMIKNTFLKNSLFFCWKYTHHFRAQAFICYDQNFTQHKFILSHMQTNRYIQWQHVKQFKFAPSSRCAVISFHFNFTQLKLEPLCRETSIVYFWWHVECNLLSSFRFHYWPYMDTIESWILELSVDTRYLDDLPNWDTREFF